MARELDLAASQTQTLLNKAIRRLSEYFDGVCSEAIEVRQQQNVASATDYNSNDTAKVVDELIERMEPTLFSSLDDDHQPELLPKKKKRRKGPIPS